MFISMFFWTFSSFVLCFCFVSAFTFAQGQAQWQAAEPFCSKAWEATRGPGQPGAAVDSFDFTAGHFETCVHGCGASLKDMRSIGKYWEVLNLFEPIWTYLNLFEPIWTYLNLFEPIWTYLNLFESIWTYLNQFESIWIYLNLFESVWIYLNLFESVWICLNLFESVWIYLNLFESIWIYLNLFESAFWETCTEYHCTPTKVFLKFSQSLRRPPTVATWLKITEPNLEWKGAAASASWWGPPGRVPVWL